jgi:hypothetical protein
MKRLALVLSSSCVMFSTEPYTASRDMRLYVTIDSGDTGTHVSAEITGPLGSVDLGPNDSLALLVDGAPITSARATGLELDLAARSGDFTFVIHHEGDHDVAVDVTLVPTSNIHATSAAGKLLLDWTPFPEAGATTITVAGTCILSQTIHVQTDTGHYELLASQLQAQPGSCAVSLGLSRSLDAQIPFLGQTFMYATVTQAEIGQGQWTP